MCSRLNFVCVALQQSTSSAGVAGLSSPASRAPLAEYSRTPSPGRASSSQPAGSPFLISSTLNLLTTAPPALCTSHPACCALARSSPRLWQVNSCTTSGEGPSCRRAERALSVWHERHSIPGKPQQPDLWEDTARTACANTPDLFLVQPVSSCVLRRARDGLRLLGVRDTTQQFFSSSSSSSASQ
jgi:hypothetical protein